MDMERSKQIRETTNTYIYYNKRLDHKSNLLFGLSYKIKVDSCHSN